MTLRTSLFRATVLAAVLALSAGSAQALIVFDPKNYSQNLLTAARTLEQINHQITQLSNEAQMLINQASNLTALPQTLIGEIEGNFAEMRALVGEAQQLAYNVENLEGEFQSAFRDFGRAGASSADLVEGARERWRQSLSGFEHSMKAGAVAVGNIEGTADQTRQLLASSKSAVGILQAAQAGNELIAVQNRQLADLTAMLAAQGRAEALEGAREAAAAEQARQQFARFMAGSGYAESSVSMFHD